MASAAQPAVTPVEPWPGRLRILALDGGGIRGVFTASLLAGLEQQLGRRVADHFDLIVGTSTGAILALGLGLGVSPAEMTELYRKNGANIFPAGTAIARMRGILRHLRRPKHKPDALRAAVHGVLGDKKLGESKTRLVIPTFDALKGTACTFKTAHHSRLHGDIDLLAADVAVAAAAAPTYYPAAKFPSRAGASYVDGGIWANTPVLAGITEAVHYLGAPLTGIHMLSIGTTEEIQAYFVHKKSGLLGWNIHLINAMMTAQATGAISQASLMLPADNFMRCSLSVKVGADFDDARPATIERLAELGASIARGNDTLDKIAAKFLDGQHAAAFTPVAKVKR